MDKLLLPLFVVGLVCSNTANAQSMQPVENSMQSSEPLRAGIQLSSVSPPSAASVPDASNLKPSVPVVGTFFGQCNGRPMWTEIKLDQNGYLTGTYHHKSMGGYNGRLDKARVLSLHEVAFTWHDRFGSGALYLLYDPWFNSFSGAWGSSEIRTTGLSWTGVRQ